jgi:hypothetical protein
VEIPHGYLAMDRHSVDIGLWTSKYFTSKQKTLTCDLVLEVLVMNLGIWIRILDPRDSKYRYNS